MSKIRYGKCSLCGDEHASVAPRQVNGARGLTVDVCRNCDPENWQAVADEEKNAYLRGDLDDFINPEATAVWCGPNHSQR